MKRFTPDAGGRDAAAANPSSEQAPDLSSLLNYPSLGRLFDTPASPALGEMRGRLTRTNQELERVIRQGTKEDADRAARVSRAYTTTLAFLDSLEEVQREAGG